LRRFIVRTTVQWCELSFPDKLTFSAPAVCLGQLQTRAFPRHITRASTIFLALSATQSPFDRLDYLHCFFYCWCASACVQRKIHLFICSCVLFSESYLRSLNRAWGNTGHLRACEWTETLVIKLRSCFCYVVSFFKVFVLSDLFAKFPFSSLLSVQRWRRCVSTTYLLLFNYTCSFRIMRRVWVVCLSRAALPLPFRSTQRSTQTVRLMCWVFISTTQLDKKENATIMVMRCPNM